MAFKLCYNYKFNQTTSLLFTSKGTNIHTTSTITQIALDSFLFHFSPQRTEHSTDLSEASVFLTDRTSQSSEPRTKRTKSHGACQSTICLKPPISQSYGLTSRVSRPKLPIRGRKMLRRSVYRYFGIRTNSIHLTTFQNTSCATLLLATCFSDGRCSNSVSIYDMHG